jgi:hypothetical protein
MHRTPNGDAPAPPRRRRLLRRLLVAFLLLVALAVAARIALPSYLKAYVNRVLDQSPDYDGQVGDIEVHLWRGAYAVDELEIVKTTHAVAVPFFEARRVAFRLDWDSLLHGSLRGKILMESPRLNFVDGESEEDTQTGEDQPWLAMLDQLFPFRIDKARIKDGEIHLHTFHVKPAVDVYLSDVQATVTNLTNVEDKVDPLMARVEATGTAMDSGKFNFEMSLDPSSYRPNFSLAMRLLDLDVTRLDALTRAYGDFDFAAGRFDLVVEVSTKNGFVDGYAKPLFRHLQVLSVRDFQTDDPLQILWEALVGAVSTVFKNQSRDQFGTSLSISGNLDNPRTSILEIVGNILRNAFVRAYLPKFDRRLTPAEIERSGEETGKQQ